MPATRAARPGARVSALAGGLLLALTLPAAAQTAPVTYTEGSAQLLVRLGPAMLETFRLASGDRDATAGRLTLRYVSTSGGATLDLTTPDIPGAHAGGPGTPRGASVRYRGLRGLSGQRAGCTIAWNELADASIAGSLTCPRERTTGARRTRYAVVGAFSARAVPDGPDAPDPAVAPVYPTGSSVRIAGVTVTPTGVADIAAACVQGRGSTDDAVACPPKHVPVAGTWRALGLQVCVADDAEALPLLDRAGYSRIMLAGEPGSPLPVGVPALVRDPAVTDRPLPRVVNPGSCVGGHLLAGTQGPMLAWRAPDGSTVAWTLDAVALPPTADAPPIDPAGASPGPTPGGPVVPAGSTTYTTGAADLLHDGSELLAVDDLTLAAGSLESDGVTAHLHLEFSSAAGSLTIDLPGPDGVSAWDPGTASATMGVAYTLGELAVAAADAGCEVDVAATEAGGVQGSYACVLGAGGSASGSFIANP